jgi:transcriptional regulator with XRE-family HTH domain
MSASVDPRLPGSPRKQLAMTGESLRKKLAGPTFGAVIARALQIKGWTQLRLAQELGYGDNQAPVSRWIAGTEAPPIERLWDLAALRLSLLVALAEAVQDDAVQVNTVVTLRRLA